MSRFPMLKDIAGVCALVVGGGPVALRRGEILAQFGARVRIVAPEIADEPLNPAVEYVQKKFDADDLRDVQMVVVATDDHALNAQIAQLCRAQKIEVNAADDAKASTFHFPAIVRRGDMTVAVSAGDAGPLAAKYVRERIEAALPENFERVLECMACARALARKEIIGQQERAQVLKEVFARCLEGEFPDETALEGIFHRPSCT